jgi:hypothetical protein
MRVGMIGLWLEEGHAVLRPRLQPRALGCARCFL